MSSAGLQAGRELAHLHSSEREALHALRRSLRREFEEDFLSLRLFGSRARGEGCAWAYCPEHIAGNYDRLSDLDVVIFLREPSREKQRRALRARGEIELDFGVVFDPKYYTPEAWQEGLARELLFYEEVEREGIEV